MVCGSCHANVSRLSHDLQGYTFGLRPGLIQDSGGFCQIVSVKEKTTHVVCFRAACLLRGPFSFLDELLNRDLIWIRRHAALRGESVRPGQVTRNDEAYHRHEHQDSPPT